MRRNRNMCCIRLRLLVRRRSHLVLAGGLLLTLFVILFMVSRFVLPSASPTPRREYPSRHVGQIVISRDRLVSLDEGGVGGGGGRRPVMETDLKNLRLVVMSDTHGMNRRSIIPSGDVLVHVGDFSHGGTLETFGQFNAWMETLPHPHKLVMIGNHDFDPSVGDLYSIDKVRSLLPCCHVLHNSDFDVPIKTMKRRGGGFSSGLAVRFHAMPWIPPSFQYMAERPGYVSYDGRFVWKTEEEILDELSQIRAPESIGVLMTHTPAYRIMDRMPENYRVPGKTPIWSHRGSKALRWALLGFDETVPLDEKYVDEDYVALLKKRSMPAKSILPNVALHLFGHNHVLHEESDKDLMRIPRVKRDGAAVIDDDKNSNVDEIAFIDCAIYPPLQPGTPPVTVDLVFR